MFPVSQVTTPNPPGHHEEKKQPSDFRITRILESALQGHPQVQPHLESVANLAKISSKSRPKTNDPEKFFRPFKIDGLARLYKPADIDALYQIFERHPMSNCLTFHDYFGLEFDRLLSIFSKKIDANTAKKMNETWESLFLCGYLGLLRNNPEQMPPISADTQTYFHLARTYRQKFDELDSMLKTIIETEKTRRKQGKRPKAQKQIDDFFAKPISEWNTAKRLFSSFLIHNKATHILSQVPLASFPGSQQRECTTCERLPEALNTFEHYIDLISRAQNTAIQKRHIGIQYTVFNEVLKLVSALKGQAKPAQLQAVRFLMEKINQETQTKRDVLYLLKDAISKVEQGQLTHELWCELNGITIVKAKGKEEFIESLLQRSTLTYLSISWLDDFRIILEHSILTPLDPSHRGSEAYYNRIMANLHGITDLKTVGSEPINPLKDELSRQSNQLSELIVSQDFAQVVSKLFIMNSKHIQLINFIMQDLIEVRDILTPFIAGSLRSLSQFIETHGQDCKRLPILDNTKFLAQAYILYSDLQVITNQKQQNEETTLPDVYLKLLSLETIAEEYSSDSPVEELAEEVDRGDDTPTAQIEIMEPAEPEERSNRALAGGMAKRQSKEIRQRKERKKASLKDLLEQRKLRDIERVLISLGCRMIRQKGSHRTYRNNETGRQTTLAVHDEITLYSRKKMFEDLKAQSL